MCWKEKIQWQGNNTECVGKKRFNGREIIQNVLERKDSMAECYQRASERACVTSPLFGQGITSLFFSYGYL